MRWGLAVDLVLIAANLAGWLLPGSHFPSFSAFVTGLLIASATDDLIRKGWRRA